MRGEGSEGGSGGERRRRRGEEKERLGREREKKKKGGEGRVEGTSGNEEVKGRRKEKGRERAGRRVYNAKPFIFNIDGRTLEYGREDFCLITGLRFGKVNLDPRKEDHSEFRMRAMCVFQALNL
ncbi:hypothetical protein Tco_0438831 [Tanacetum coccineum]